MSSAVDDEDERHAAAVGTRYLLRFEADTLKQRPLWIRLIIEFLGTFLLVTVAAGPASSIITPAAARSAGPPR